MSISMMAGRRKWNKNIEIKKDYVRDELERALDLGTKMVPVFTSSNEGDFSTSLRLQKIRKTLSSRKIRQALDDRQGLLLRTDPDFNRDLEKLVETIWAAVRNKEAILHQLGSFRRA